MFDYGSSLVKLLGALNNFPIVNKNVSTYQLNIIQALINKSEFILNGIFQLPLENLKKKNAFFHFSHNFVHFIIVIFSCMQKRWVNNHIKPTDDLLKWFVEDYLSVEINILHTLRKQFQVYSTFVYKTKCNSIWEYLPAC